MGFAGVGLEEEADVAGGEDFGAGYGDAFEGETADLEAFEAFDAVAERFEETADFAFFAVVEMDFPIGEFVAATGADREGFFDVEVFAFEIDSFEEERDFALGERLVEGNGVAFDDEVGRVHEPVGEFAVGGENEEAFAVEIEAAGAEEAAGGEFAGEEFVNRFVVVGVAVAAKVAAGFVHGEGDRFGGGWLDEFSADDDAVAAGFDPLSEDGGFAVHFDFAVFDEGFGGAAGTDAGGGEKFLEADSVGRRFGHATGK